MLDYEAQNDDEEDFIEKLLGTITLMNMSIEDIAKNRRSITERIALLQKISNLLSKNKQKKYKLASTQAYENALCRKITNMEKFNSSFLSIELENKKFKFTNEDKIKVKRMIFTSLPTADAINKTWV